MNPDRAEIRDVLELVAREAAAYLDGLDERPVRTRNVEEAAEDVWRRSFEMFARQLR